MISCIHGYHIYHLIWDSCIGETLCCDDVQDRFAVSVKQDIRNGKGGAMGLSYLISKYSI